MKISELVSHKLLTSALNAEVERNWSKYTRIKLGLYSDATLITVYGNEWLLKTLQWKAQAENTPLEWIW